MMDVSNVPDDDPMLQRIADTIYSTSIKQSKEHISEKTLPLADISRVFDAATHASDREAAIVIFCLVDDLTTSFFKEKLTGHVSGGIDAVLLSGNGMLASAYNKISLLSGLDWIRSRTYKNLGLMRKIRNEFAHHVHLVCFDESPVQDFVNSIEAPEERPIVEMLHPDLRPIMSVRRKFFIRSALTVGHMIIDFRVSQAALAHNVHPGSILSKFDDHPDNIKALLSTVSGICLDALGRPKNRSVHV